MMPAMTTASEPSASPRAAPSRPSASSASARWVPASPKSSPATATRVTGVEISDEAVERGRQHLEHSTARAVKRGQADRGGAGRAAGPDHADHRPGGPRRVRLRGRGGRGVDRDQEGDLPAARRRRRSPTRSWRPTPPPSLSPRSRRPTPARAGSSASTSSTRRRCRTSSRSSARWSPSPTCSPTSRADRRAGQEPRGLRRQGRLHRQHAAVRLPQPRGLDVRGAATPRVRTSTPPCGSAAATRWGRWRCST